MLSHTTVLDEAWHVLEFLDRHPLVTKVTIGPFVPTGTRIRRLRMWPSSTGFRMRIYGNNGLQMFYIHTRDHDRVRADVATEWNAP